MEFSKLTKGSGIGGGGSKQPEQRQPIESPNTLQARMSARVVDVVAEGQCYGLANGLQSVYFDDTPLQLADGSITFAGVEVFERYGLPDQEWIAGFPAVETEVSVGVKVKAGEANTVTRRITNINATAARVTIVVAALFEQDTKTGDTRGSTLSFDIQVRRVAAGAGWVQYPQTIEGKTMGAYPAAYRVPLDGDGPWDVRVIRITPDSNRSTLGNDMSWQSYTEIVDYKLTYSRSAVIATIYNAEQTSNVPRRSFDYKGWICRVPVGYDAENRTYPPNHFWDGTYKYSWTDDPAWLFLQLLTHESGAAMADSQIDKFTLYEISRYASELVPDGYGGFEPRFSANFILNTRQEAYACINALASCMRAMTFWESGAVQIVADMPREPDIQISNSNTMGDSGFDYNSPDFNSVHNACLVSFLDKDNNYEPSVETVEDAEGIAQNGYNEIEITAFACTSRGQAHRLGKWLLDTEKYGSEGVSYRASLEHLTATPGMIAEISDRDYAHLRIGGRIVSATQSSVTLDDPFVIEPGVNYTLRVTLPDGTLAKAPVSRPPGTYNTITVNPPLPAVPAQHAQWAMLASNLVPRQFKIMGVSESSPLEFDIAGLIHDPTKFARVEQGINLARPPTTRLPNPGIIAPPEEVEVSREYVSNGTTFVDSLQVRWKASDDPYVRGYLVSYQKNSSGWVRRQEVPGTVDIIYGEGAGRYTFHVQAVNFASVASRPAVLDVNILDESPITLLRPTGLQLDGQGNNTEFTGRDPKFVWRATAIRGSYPMGEEPAAGAGYLDHIFRDFEIRIIDQFNNVVFVDHTTLTSYTFAFEKNYGTRGGPHRTFTFQVVMRDIWGNPSRPADLKVSNPAPALPLALRIVPGFEIVFVEFERPTDLDFLGTMIWMSDTSGFLPGPQYLAYDGPDTFKSIRAPALTKQYVRLAGYDSFSKDPAGLNVTGEFEVLIGGVRDVDFLPPAIPTGLQLSTSSATTPDGVKRYKLKATWDANTEADLQLYGVAIAEEGGGFIVYTTDEPNYEWDVIAGATYVVQLRSKDSNGNFSLFSEEKRLFITGDTDAPETPTGLKAQGALRTIALSWDQHPAPDFDYMEIWEAPVNNRAQATPIVGAYGTAYSRTIPDAEFPEPPPAAAGESAPLPSVERWYWIRARDTSRNPSAFFPASTTGGIHAVTGKLKVVDFGADAVIKGFMIDVEEIDDTHIRTLRADKITAGSTLSGTIKVDNKYSLGVALDAAGDPVGTINRGTTTIDPGKILIQGNTRLSDWKAGGDSTEINGGVISANSIRANSLSIGNRQVQFIGINFEALKDEDSIRWTGGTIIWQGTNGAHNSEGVGAGQIKRDPRQGILYLCWTPGLGYINFTYDPNIYANNSYLVIGQYYGGSGLVMTYGRTQIDGDYIRTGTVDAQHIKAKSISATHLSTQTLITSQAQIGSGSIADFHFGTGKIDGARINNLSAGQISSGGLAAVRIQVGGTFGTDRDAVVIEGQFGYRAIRYHDSNGITRVEIGQNRPTPNPALDGFYVRDINGKVLIGANGFGVDILGTSALNANAVTKMHFVDTHTMGWPSYAGGDIHVVTYLSAFMGSLVPIGNTNQQSPVPYSIGIRFLLNGGVAFQGTMSGAAQTTTFANSYVFAAPSGTGLTWQAQMMTDGNTWRAFGDVGIGLLTGSRCQIVSVEYKR